MKKELVFIKNKYFLLAIFFVFVLFLLILTGVRGVVYSDEGYVLYSAERIISGQLPYKDFHFAYTPLSSYITALSFMLFGKGILVGRILMIVLSLVTSFVLYLLLQKITKNLFITLSGVMLYILWAPLHGNFPWPVLFSISFSIFSLFFFLEGIKSKNAYSFFFSGIFASLVLLSKQNFGVVILINVAIAFLYMLPVKRWQMAGWFFLGWIVPVSIYAMYLFGTGSIAPFISDFYRYTWQRIILEQTLTTPFFYGDTLLEKGAKLVFYTAPLFVGMVAVVLAFFRNRTLLFLASFVILFYLVGIRPTTDYIHLAPLLSLLGIPLVMCWELEKNHYLKIFVVTISCVFIILGMYSAWFIGYYRWEPPLAIQDKYLSLPKTHVFLNIFHKDELTNIQKVVNAQTTEDDPIFVNGYMPLLYFVLNRHNPTPYDLLEPTAFYFQDEKRIVEILRKKQVKLIITRHNPGDTYVGKYIKKEYNKSSNVNAFSIWKKK